MNYATRSAKFLIARALDARALVDPTVGYPIKKDSRKIQSLELVLIEKLGQLF